MPDALDVEELSDKKGVAVEGNPYFLGPDWCARVQHAAYPHPSRTPHRSHAHGADPCARRR